MDKKDIIVFAAIMTFVAIRLFLKYFKKNKISHRTDKNSSYGKSFPPSGIDEDYEPYSKKDL